MRRVALAVVTVAVMDRRPDKPGQDGFTPLMHAARDGDVARIRALVDDGAAVDYQGREIVRQRVLPFNRVGSHLPSSLAASAAVLWKVHESCDPNTPGDGRTAGVPRPFRPGTMPGRSGRGRPTPRWGHTFVSPASANGGQMKGVTPSWAGRQMKGLTPSQEHRTAPTSAACSSASTRTGCRSAGRNRPSSTDSPATSLSFSDGLRCSARSCATTRSASTSPPTPTPPA